MDIAKKVGCVAGGATLRGAAITALGAVIGVTTVGPVAGGAFAVAQAAGWMGVPYVGAGMAAVQSAVMLGGISTTGAAIGAGIGGFVSRYITGEQEISSQEALDNETETEEVVELTTKKNKQNGSGKKTEANTKERTKI